MNTHDIMRFLDLMALLGANKVWFNRHGECHHGFDVPFVWKGECFKFECDISCGMLSILCKSTSGETMSAGGNSVKFSTPRMQSVCEEMTCWNKHLSRKLVHYNYVQKFVNDIYYDINDGGEPPYTCIDIEMKYGPNRQVKAIFVPFSNSLFVCEKHGTSGVTIYYRQEGKEDVYALHSENSIKCIPEMMDPSLLVDFLWDTVPEGSVKDMYVNNIQYVMKKSADTLDIVQDIPSFERNSVKLHATGNQLSPDDEWVYLLVAAKMREYAWHRCSPPFSFEQGDIFDGVQEFAVDSKANNRLYTVKRLPHTGTLSVMCNDGDMLSYYIYSKATDSWFGGSHRVFTFNSNKDSVGEDISTFDLFHSYCDKSKAEPSIDEMVRVIDLDSELRDKFAAVLRSIM